MDNKNLAKKEYAELRECVADELNRVERLARTSGEWVEGLDTNAKLFALIIAEQKRRIEEIKEKYDL